MTESIDPAALRPTDGQLRAWLYDAEFDYEAEYNEDVPWPGDTFPRYYEDVYNPTLALIFRELLERRALCDEIDRLRTAVERLEMMKAALRQMHHCDRDGTSHFVCGNCVLCGQSYPCLTVGIMNASFM